jgi:hypothetical protein
MASLPKKVFKRFSGRIIHKTQIYVYLFMTFTIVSPGNKLYAGVSLAQPIFEHGKNLLSLEQAIPQLTDSFAIETLARA